MTTTASMMALLTERTAREVRNDAFNLILAANDHKITLALLDGIYLTSPDVVTLLAEVSTLRAQGAPASAYAAWHEDVCALLRRLADTAVN